MIGIFGGTFDPIHYGHLRPALEVQQALGLEQVRFIPLAVAVHRDQPAAGNDLRLAMVQAALAGQPGFVLDDREIRRAGRSYSVDTLGELRLEHPHTPLCLFVGGDAFNEFLTWHRPLAILDLAHLVVMQRPGSGGPGDRELARLSTERRCTDPAELRTAPPGRIFFQPVTQLEISATAIRAQLTGGSSPRFLLPDPVLDIIERERLYR
jgi:nicotinate-nucleotide adenylyltransferase